MDSSAVLPAGEALDQIASLLDRVDPARFGLDPATRLCWVRKARAARERLAALASLLTGEADRERAAEQSAGTPLSSWLSTGEVLSRREACGAVRAGRELATRPRLAQAAASGAVSGAQSRAIGGLLRDLEPQLDQEQRAGAERVLIALATTMDADQLRNAAGRVLAEVAPTDADELLETSLRREHETAVRGRFFRYRHRAGSLLFEGSLPRIEGAELLALLDAHSERLRRTAIEARDPLATILTGDQRRADALVAAVRAAAGADGSGAGAARVIVKLDYDRLRAGAAGAGVLVDGTQLSAGELRRLCCDAEVVPVVLGGGSDVLDVGHQARLVSRAQRAALVMRDGGCVFPGCDIPPPRCEAHHIVPWWDGGRTDLGNLVLLCRHHHGLIEPTRRGVRDQWEVRIGPDGGAELRPPSRYDPARRPLRNRRRAAAAALSIDDTG